MTQVHRLIALPLVILPLLLEAQGFKRYQAARLDATATAEAKRVAANDPGLEVSVYVTSDSFDKVYTFYKSIGSEFRMIGQRVRKLPNGEELRDAFILLDGSKDIMTSKVWVKIQRPFIGIGLARGATANDIRDVTAIVLSQRK